MGVQQFLSDTGSIVLRRTVGASASFVLLLSVLAWSARVGEGVTGLTVDGPHDDPAVEATADEDSPPTVTPSETATVKDVTPTPAPSPDAGPTMPAPTSTPPAPSPLPLECRNSVDPRCGDFFWDYDPATFPNAPLQVTMAHDPADPVAGQTVTLTLRFHDPDDRWPDNCAIVIAPGTTDQYGEGHGGNHHLPCAVPGCPESSGRHGPWDPPAPPDDSRPVTHTIELVWDAAGDHTVTVETRPHAFCSGFPGYLSPTTRTFTVTVGDPPPPSRWPPVVP